ncbi:MAG: hypothetical protein M1374_05710 [Firmicutes bacterium]|jgi:hydrogenase-4 component B|nr:hypothetical protein [Bacillota bacterium]
MIFDILLLSLAVIFIGGGLVLVKQLFKLAFFVQSFGSLLLTIVGIFVVASREDSGAQFTDKFHPQFGIDPLSGLFLIVLGIVAIPVLVFSGSYLDSDSKRDRVIACLSAAFIIILAGTVCARDPITLLGGWELMTIIPASIILIAHGNDKSVRRSGFIYVAITHIGGVGTWIAVILLAKYGVMGGGTHLHEGSPIQIAIVLSSLIGMGTKAGLMPMHVWLPRAHPAAPAPVSALMSGVMINIPIYLLIRVLVYWCRPLPVWVGIVVLTLGAVSAVGGVVYALFERQLKKLLALSSIENMGIITLGLGASLALTAHGKNDWAAIALAAALLHIINHSIFKSLLFLSAGTFEKTAKQLHIDRLSGLVHSLPVVGVSFFIGVMAISGLPPLNGFISEWLTIQSLIHVSTYGNFADGTIGAISLVAMAATVTLALFCFTKVIGLVLLGKEQFPRKKESSDSLLMGISTLFLALLCIILGLIPALYFGRLMQIAPWSSNKVSLLVLNLPGTGSLSPLCLGAILISGTFVLFLLRSNRSAKAAPTWLCGQKLTSKLYWSGSGFTKPARMILEPIIRPTRKITRVEELGITQSIEYEGEVPHLIESKLYSPISTWFMKVATIIRRVQSGSLGSYAAYLIGLIFVLLIAFRLGIL